MCIFWSKPLDLANVDLTQWRRTVAHDITATSIRLVLEQVSFQLTPERA